MLEAERLLGVLASWLAVGVVLYWPRLPGHRRRGLALGASLLGLGLLLLAVMAEGRSESETQMVYLFGASYVTGRGSASAGLAFYVLSGLCLLLGTIGLALTDAQAQRVSERWFAVAVACSLAVSVLRFVLEKAAAPEWLTFAVGITWLAPLIGAFFALHLRARAGRVWLPLTGLLLAYGLATRGFVAALVGVATRLGLGSHYDVSSVVRIRNPFTGSLDEFEPGSLEQLLHLGVFPQLAFWPLFTLAAGLVGAVLALTALRAARGRSQTR